MIERIRKKLILSYTAVIALFLTVFIGSSYAVYRYKSIQFVEDSLRDYLAEEMREAENQIRAGLNGPEIYKIASDNSAHNFSYWFVNGKLVHAEEPNDEGFAVLVKQRLQDREYRNNEIYYVNIKHNKQKRYFIVLKQDLAIDGVPTGKVFVLANYTSIRKSTKNYIAAAIWAVVFATFLAWLLGSILVARSMKYIEQSYRRQKQFVADAAHEFRTPLTILYSYAELLEYNPHKNGIVNDIKDEIQQMNDMVDRLLSIARYDTSETAATKERFFLNRLAVSVINSMSGLCPEGTFTLLGADEDLEIQADRVMIRQLLCILLDNAVKYTKENKKITLSLSKSATDVEISVQDNGIGIAGEDLCHIYDRFWRAEKSRHQKGLGLGLSLADTIVKLHKGTISVSSQPGLGTMFTVTLPRQKAA